MRPRRTLPGRPVTAAAPRYSTHRTCGRDARRVDFGKPAAAVPVDAGSDTGGCAAAAGLGGATLCGSLTGPRTAAGALKRAGVETTNRAQLGISRGTMVTPGVCAAARAAAVAVAGRAAVGSGAARPPNAARRTASELVGE